MANDLVTVDDFSPVVDLVTDTLDSHHSRRAYSRALHDFLAWYEDVGRPGLTRATVTHWRAELVASGKSAAAVNQALSAVRKLAAEAADNGLLDPARAAGIAHIRGIKQAGTRAGNWLTLEEAQRLLLTPDPGQLRGLRDRAILAVMLGGGLRVSEVAGLTFDHVQQREGRWAIVDLLGKGGRVRTVPIPSWAKAAIDAWATAAGLAGQTGRIFRPVNKAGRLTGEALTPQAVFNAVVERGRAAGFPSIRPHDLRRTFAKLGHKAGGALDQIQLSLGHASIQTTERYLGVKQDLSRAPCDLITLYLRPSY
jgi:integrase